MRANSHRNGLSRLVVLNGYLVSGRINCGDLAPGSTYQTGNNFIGSESCAILIGIAESAQLVANFQTAKELREASLIFKESGA